MRFPLLGTAQHKMLCLLAQAAEQERHDLPAGASGIGAEGGFAGAFGDAIGHSPHDGLAAVAFQAHISEGVLEHPRTLHTAAGHADEKLDSPRSQRRNYSVRTTEVYERRDAKSR